MHEENEPTDRDAEQNIRIAGNDEEEMSERDPFTWTWRLCAEESDAAGVRSWVQWIEVAGEEIHVREEVESAAGAKANVSIEARFDGKEYAVRGSSMVDAIAYTRVDRHNIAGVGKKNGIVTLRETITAAPETTGGVLTLTFAIFLGGREVMNGVAVFEEEVARQKEKADPSLRSG